MIYQDSDMLISELFMCLVILHILF